MLVGPFHASSISDRNAHTVAREKSRKVSSRLIRWLAKFRGVRGTDFSNKIPVEECGITRGGGSFAREPRFGGGGCAHTGKEDHVSL